MWLLALGGAELTAGTICKKKEGADVLSWYLKGKFGHHSPKGQMGTKGGE